MKFYDDQAEHLDWLAVIVIAVVSAILFVIASR